MWDNRRRSFSCPELNFVLQRLKLVLALKQILLVPGRKVIYSLHTSPKTGAKGENGPHARKMGHYLMPLCDTLRMRNKSQETSTSTSGPTTMSEHRLMAGSDIWRTCAKVGAKQDGTICSSVGASRTPTANEWSRKTVRKALVKLASARYFSGESRRR